MKFRMLVAGLALGAAAPLMAAEDGEMISARTPAGMVIAMLNAGFRAELTTDEYGDPLIKSQAVGYPLQIYFYECDEETHEGCSSVQFVTGFDRKEPWTAKEALEIARKQRYAAISLDDEGDPFVRWDIVTEGGIPEAVFVESLYRFEEMVSRVEEIVFADERASESDTAPAPEPESDPEPSETAAR
ncbi:MAG: hypothetical protein GC147_01555 [Porphyrobacter sp.]|nr:hypothetical protein [Porphyrobacter sp.]